MIYSYGLLGIKNTLTGNRKERQRKAMLSDPKMVLDREMEEFCKKKAAEYGIKREANLSELQLSISEESYHCEEIAMKMQLISWRKRNFCI